MGMIRDIKTDNIARDARKAWDDGASYFAAVLNMPTTRVGFSGGVFDWGPMMDAITSVGWKLHTWAVNTDEKHHGQAVPLFTRP